MVHWHPPLREQEDSLYLGVVAIVSLLAAQSVYVSLKQLSLLSGDHEEEEEGFGDAELDEGKGEGAERPN